MKKIKSYLRLSLRYLIFFLEIFISAYAIYLVFDYDYAPDSTSRELLYVRLGIILTSFFLFCVLETLKKYLKEKNINMKILKRDNG